MVVSSLTSCDPGDVHETISHLGENGIRCSVIGLSAEVWIYKRLCTITKGTYGVSLDESHLKLLVSNFAAPQAANTLSESALIKMGFPFQSPAAPALCSCSNCLSSNSNKQSEEKSHANLTGYSCPQCGAKICDLPTECRVCGLPLLTAAHLARAYCHLFPIAAFVPQTDEDSLTDNEVHRCFGCENPMQNNEQAYACKNCSNIFCPDCDIFIHGTLHSCPGCIHSAAA